MAKNKAKAHVYTPGIYPGTHTVLHSVLKEAGMNTTAIHYSELVQRSKQNICKACQAGSRYASKKPRRVLAEVSINARPRAPRTSYSCSQCLVSLCQSKICWEDHIHAYNSNK
jgi:hypothetical protein